MMSDEQVHPEVFHQRMIVDIQFLLQVQVVYM